MNTTNTDRLADYFAQKEKAEEALVQKILKEDASLRLSDEQLQRLKDEYDLVFKAFQENDNMEVTADNGQDFVFTPNQSCVNFRLDFNLKNQIVRIKKSEWIERSEEIAKHMLEVTDIERKCQLAEEHLENPDETYDEIENALSAYNYDIDDFYDGFVQHDVFNDELKKKIDNAYLLYCKELTLNPYKTLQWKLTDRGTTPEEYYDFLHSFEEPDPEDVCYIVSYQMSLRTKHHLRLNSITNELTTTQKVRHFLSELDALAANGSRPTLKEVFLFARDLFEGLKLSGSFPYDVFATDHFDGNKDLNNQYRTMPIADVYDFATLKEDSHATA